MALVDELRSALGLTIEPVRPASLTRLAESVILRLPARPPGLEAEDLAQDFLTELLDRGRAVQEDLLAREALQIRAIVWRRLTQLAVEAAPQWDRYRALKTHVAAALAGPLPAAPETAPMQLGSARTDRLSRELVCQAVAWILSHGGRPPRHAGVITRHLMQLYYPPDESMDADDGTPADARSREDRRGLLRNPEMAMYGSGQIARRGAHLAKQLRKHVPADELDALCGVYEGETLHQTATRLGVSVSTIWERQRRAAERVRQLISRPGFSTQRTLAVAFGLLAKDSALRRIVGYYVEPGQST